MTAAVFDFEAISRARACMHGEAATGVEFDASGDRKADFTRSDTMARGYRPEQDRFWRMAEKRKQAAAFADGGMVVFPPGIVFGEPLRRTTVVVRPSGKDARDRAWSRDDYDAADHSARTYVGVIDRIEAEPLEVACDCAGGPCGFRHYAPGRSVHIHYSPGVDSETLRKAKSLLSEAITRAHQLQTRRGNARG